MKKLIALTLVIAFMSITGTYAFRTSDQPPKKIEQSSKSSLQQVSETPSVANLVSYVKMDIASPYVSESRATLYHTISPVAFTDADVGTVVLPINLQRTNLSLQRTHYTEVSNRYLNAADDKRKPVTGNGVYNYRNNQRSPTAFS